MSAPDMAERLTKLAEFYEREAAARPPIPKMGVTGEGGRRYRKALKIGGGWQPIYSGWLRDGDLIVDHSGVTVVGKVPFHPPSNLSPHASSAAREGDGG